MVELIFALWVIWTDGNVSANHCHQFAYAVEAAAGVKNQDLPAVLAALEGADITDYKRDMFSTAVRRSKPDRKPDRSSRYRLSDVHG